MEYAVFKKALEEANKTKKFKLLNTEINMAHRAIGLLIENGFASDSMFLIGMEKYLVKLTRLRSEVLKC